MDRGKEAEPGELELGSVINSIPRASRVATRRINRSFGRSSFSPFPSPRGCLFPSVCAYACFACASETQG